MNPVAAFLICALPLSYLLRSLLQDMRRETAARAREGACLRCGGRDGRTKLAVHCNDCKEEVGW